MLWKPSFRPQIRRRAPRPRAPLPPRARNEVAEAIDLPRPLRRLDDKCPPAPSSATGQSCRPSAHFNFSVPEPTGVMRPRHRAPDPRSPSAFIATIAPIIAGGNHHRRPRLPHPPPSPPSQPCGKSSTDSDLPPAGVVNILTGDLPELPPPPHHPIMDVNGIAAHRPIRRHPPPSSAKTPPSTSSASPSTPPHRPLRRPLQNPRLPGNQKQPGTPPTSANPNPNPCLTKDKKIITQFIYLSLDLRLSTTNLNHCHESN